MDWLKKIRTLEEAEIQAKRQAATKTELDLWRWFTLEADKVYRQSPKSADSWNLHKTLKSSAQEHCKTGDITAAKTELEKALQALQGAALTQPDLLTA